MNESTILEALVDWNLWGNFEQKAKKRESVPKPTKGTILVIKGIRRSGKSTLAYMLASAFPKKQSLIINFEDPRLKQCTSEDIIKIVEIYQKHINEGLPRLLVLDEVQNIDGWEKTARLYLDAKNIDVVVTGSSSKLMGEEYATVLTGRHKDFELFPLSFREALMWNGIDPTAIDVYTKRIKLLRTLEKYIMFGGFPKVFLLKDKREKTTLLREYFNDIIIKDIVKRFEIKEIAKAENLAHLYLSHISTMQSYNKLKHVVNLSLDSVERFSRYFNTARLFFFVPKFSYSLKQQLLSVKKVYCIDSGFFNALGFRFSKNRGRLMENIVAVELMRKRSYWNSDLALYYWRDYKQHEVDFVVTLGRTVKQLIQVTSASSKEDVESREIKGLLKASTELKCKNLLVITDDYESEEIINRKKVRFVPLWKWLINTQI